MQASYRSDELSFHRERIPESTGAPVRQISASGRFDDLRRKVRKRCEVFDNELEPRCHVHQHIRCHCRCDGEQKEKDAKCSYTQSCAFTKLVPEPFGARHDDVLVNRVCDGIQALDESERARTGDDASIPPKPLLARASEGAIPG